MLAVTSGSFSTVFYILLTQFEDGDVALLAPPPHPLDQRTSARVHEVNLRVAGDLGGVFSLSLSNLVLLPPPRRLRKTTLSWDLSQILRARRRRRRRLGT